MLAQQTGCHKIISKFTHSFNAKYFWCSCRIITSAPRCALMSDYKHARNKYLCLRENPHISVYENKSSVSELCRYRSRALVTLLCRHHFIKRRPNQISSLGGRRCELSREDQARTVFTATGCRSDVGNHRDTKSAQTLSQTLTCLISDR